MAIDHYEAARRRIGSIQTRLDETIQSLKRNTSLSDQGRRAEMARATVDAQRMTERVRDEIVGARKQEHARLSRHLFGIGEGEGGVVAARDARDRVKKIEDTVRSALKEEDGDKQTNVLTGARDAALKELKDAQLSGDRGMQRAITKLAVDKGWDSLVNAYVDGLPAEEVTATYLCLRQLAAIPSGTRTAAADNAVFRVRPPTELHGYDDAGLERLAASASTDTSQPTAPMWAHS